METFSFNGIDASTGEYFFPEVSAERVCRIARGERVNREHEEDLEWWARHNEEGLGTAEGIDPMNLAEAGWGVIFARDADPAVREALGELFDYRKSQATEKSECYYQEYSGSERGYAHGQSKIGFLSQYGAAFSPADPEYVPYYLLIVGDPEAIPYSFQYQLDVQYAVGRIHFQTPDEYANYARSVVAAERGGVAGPRRAVFFGVDHDRVTRLSARDLVEPLAERLAEARRDWEIQTLTGAEATKGQLAHLLGGDDTPALLFTASHGLAFRRGDPRQMERQGALICQDWAGPGSGPVGPEHCFAADDLPEDARLRGLIAFHFACFSAGTPQVDNFSFQSESSPEPLAPAAFVSRLPQRMLGRPDGALAVIGHVERAWGCSFKWPGAGRQIEVFRSVMERLTKGCPVGAAVEYINARYAELSTALTHLMTEERENGYVSRPEELSNLWIANNDARGYVVVGDPAVRLAV
jgi:hypothetical protein